MTFDLHIKFDDQGPEGLALKSLVNRYGVSPEEVLKRGVAKLAAEGGEDFDNFDYLFTPQKIAEIRAAEAEAETGADLTIEQVRLHLKAKNKAWQQINRT